jgi:hypothetical protein
MLAKDSQTPRGFRFAKLSLTTIASRLALTVSNKNRRHKKAARKRLLRERGGLVTDRTSL